MQKDPRPGNQCRSCIIIIIIIIIIIVITIILIVIIVTSQIRIIRYDHNDYTGEGLSDCRPTTSCKDKILPGSLSTTPLKDGAGALGQ